VPGLDRDAGVVREPREARIEPVGGGLQRGRQLQQHRAEQIAQTGGRFHQPGDRLGGIGQPLHVREEPARLHRHHEPVGEPLAPFGEVVVRGQPVEGVVHLHGVELGRVVLEPEPLR
jgi:hypothetical protein